MNIYEILEERKDMIVFLCAYIDGLKQRIRDLEEVIRQDQVAEMMKGAE